METTNQETPIIGIYAYQDGTLTLQETIKKPCAIGEVKNGQMEVSLFGFEGNRKKPLSVQAWLMSLTGEQEPTKQASKEVQEAAHNLVERALMDLWNDKERQEQPWATSDAQVIQMAEYLGHHDLATDFRNDLI